MWNKGLCRSVLENAVTRGLQAPNFVFPLGAMNLLIWSLKWLEIEQHYCEQQELIICGIKRWVIPFACRTQLSHDWSPTAIPKPWLFRGWLALSMWRPQSLSVARPSYYSCQTLVEEAKPKHVRGQGQPKSSGIALFMSHLNIPGQ